MRGRLQQIGRQLVTTPRGHCRAGWLMALVATAVYLLTLDRSVSWWDCGEFIATSHGLFVGHPPGAPFYQLLAHCFTLLSFGHPLWVAPLSNALSALCAGLTVMLLFRSALLLLFRAGFPQPAAFLGSAVGALCYLFCDTAWFSAVESEVYAMAMLFCSLDVWLILRWEQRGDNRLLLLLALSMGLGVCVHLMTLLVAPMLLWVFVRNAKAFFASRPAVVAVLGCLLFLAGLTPYAIVPLRAATHPPINEGDPSTAERFARYLRREQYEKAPLYPRQWRQRDAANWEAWGGGDPASLWSNAKYAFVYQFGYMYCRYLMYNYIGRENLSSRGIRYPLFVLPFLLGLAGLAVHCRRRRGDFAALLLLFLFGGVVLNLYLNHPCYEPRERDYAYVLSFYAFAFWISFGAAAVAERWRRRWIAPLLLVAPLLMAVGNWPDHDRSRCHSVHDLSMAHLSSCDPGAILFTYGDNDTFPLWYLRYVEGQRPDVDIHNINLTGYAEVMRLIVDNRFRRPVYFSQYAYDRLSPFFPGRLRCEGLCWRLLPSACGVDAPEPLRRHVQYDIQWHITPTEYLDPVSRSLMRVWQTNTQDL